MDPSLSRLTTLTRIKRTPSSAEKGLASKGFGGKGKVPVEAGIDKKEVVKQNKERAQWQGVKKKG